MNDIEPPVNVGDIIDLEIEEIGSKGDGFGKHTGFIIFVPETQKGDKVKVEVTRVLNNYGFARKI